MPDDYSVFDIDFHCKLGRFSSEQLFWDGSVNRAHWSASGMQTPGALRRGKIYRHRPKHPAYARERRKHPAFYRRYIACPKNSFWRGGAWQKRLAEATFGNHPFSKPFVNPPWYWRARAFPKGGFS